MSSKTCPSYLAIPNSFEIGIINEKNKTVFHNTPRRLNKLDLERLSDVNIPIENQIRIAGLCVKNACNHWSNTQKSCDLASSISQRDLFAPYEDYTNCPIQYTCRWKAEHGENICPKCMTIIRYQNS